LPIDTLKFWRNTDVGPPYFKLSTTSQGKIRYPLDRVQERQKRCQRVIPDGWQSIGTFPGESVPTDATDRIQWMPPGHAAIAIEVQIPTMTAWRKRAGGLPFIWIGGGGTHQVMYDHRDVEAFLSSRQADPSIVPVIERTMPRKNPRTREERYRMLAEVWKGMGHSNDEIRQRLGRRFADLIWPK